MQLLDECYFQEVEKIKTIGSSYMAASGLSPDRQVSIYEIILKFSLWALKIKQNIGNKCQPMC